MKTTQDDQLEYSDRFEEQDLFFKNLSLDGYFEQNTMIISILLLVSCHKKTLSSIVNRMLEKRNIQMYIYPDKSGITNSRRD
jgi:hypothetical protein